MADPTKTIDVHFVVGDTVTIGAITETGRVSGVRIGSFGAEYLVVYWMNGELREEWLEPWEIA